MLPYHTISFSFLDENPSSCIIVHQILLNPVVDLKMLSEDTSILNKTVTLYSSVWNLFITYNKAYEMIECRENHHIVVPSGLVISLVLGKEPLHRIKMSLTPLNSVAKRSHAAAELLT